MQRSAKVVLFVCRLLLNFKVVLEKIFSAVLSKATQGRFWQAGREMWQIGTSITEKVWKLTSPMCVQVKKKIYIYTYIYRCALYKGGGSCALWVGTWMYMKPAYTGHIYIH